ncbi:MAG: flagellar biosynthetic protein FliO [Phycisphaerales bacterium]
MRNQRDTLSLNVSRGMRAATVSVTCAVLFGATLALAGGAAAAMPVQDRPLFRNGSAPAHSAAIGLGAGSAAAANPAADASADASAADLKSLAAGGSSSFAKELLPTGAALGATLLAIVLARSAVKRFGGKLVGAGRPQGVVEVLARYPVARGQHIVLLKVGRRVIVTHQGAQGMKTLSEFSGEAEVADLIGRCEAGARASSPFSFDALLRQSGKSIDADEGRAERLGAGAAERGATAAKPAAAAAARGRRLDPRDALPELMRDAEIETVDLTRGRRHGGAR